MAIVVNVGLISACQSAVSRQAAPPPATAVQQSGKPALSDDPAQAVLKKMTLEDKIGQLVFAGFDGSAVTEQTKQLLQSNHLGGLIVYKPNVQSSASFIELVNKLKQANRESGKLPLWIGVDEEGGRVTRLPADVTKMPASQVIGNKNDLELARSVGGMLGKELQAFGLNVDFAPVLDVNSNPSNPVIGDRSFGADAETVSRLGVETMQGLQERGVMPVVKHFPGHGDTSVDSHIGLPVVQHDLTRLRSLELIPFAQSIKAQADAVMVAHILLPKLDEKYPASMSKALITDLLRKEMGFQGLVMTDDMTMGAITSQWELGAAAVQAVLAGADVVLVGHEADNVRTVIQALHQAVNDGRIRIESVDASTLRVIKLKQKYGIKDEEVPTPDVAALNREAARLLGK